LSPDAAYRIEELLALLPEEALGFLADRLDCRDTIAGLRDALAANQDVVARHLATLSDEAGDLLLSLANIVPPVVPDEISDNLHLLLNSGLLLAVEIQLEPRLYVPLEIQEYLFQKRGQADPDLRLLLRALSDEEVRRLESLYNSAPETEEPDEDNETDRVIELATSMERRSTLREIYHNLPATAQEVLGWTCEHSGPLSSDEVDDLARDAAAYHGERAGVAVAQLLRFGLLMSHQLEESGEVLVVPRSLRPTLLNLVDLRLATKAREHYEALVHSGHLGFPDEGPHGWGGDALAALRQLTINWVSGHLEELPPEYGVAVGLQILNPNARETASFASLLLDLSGETPLARQALRLWLALVDDPWTLDLIEATGGDAKKLTSYFASTKPDMNNEDAEIWFGHLFLQRAQLLLALSLLPPGKWYSIQSLAEMYHQLVARSTIANLTHESLSAQFPYEALPDYGVVIGRDRSLPRIKAWLESWLIEFISVVGAAQVDKSGDYFRVHPDAFCVFRDSDLWFRAVWTDLTPVVGDDLDIWMPIPNDTGRRVSGVADIWVTGSTRLATSRDVHLFDLLRLARWADPTAEPAGFGFKFTKDSVSRGLEGGNEGEELLVWLSVRLHGQVPPAIRSLFPQSSSAADGNAELWRGAAVDRVEELLASLDSWAASPPAGLLEEIRSWGSAAVEPVSRRLQEMLETKSLEDPRIQHNCVLLGELGAARSAPLVISVLKEAPNEFVGHAAAAACMRLGKSCLPTLITLTKGASVAKDTRLLAAMALTGIATLHPDTYHDVGDTLLQATEQSAFDTELQTRFILELCRMGHFQAEPLIEQLQSDDGWSNPDWQPEDALWLARISPCVWGSLLYSTPLAMLYLVSDEADELAREAGIGDLLVNAGLSSDAVLYGRPRPSREEQN